MSEKSGDIRELVAERRIEVRSLPIGVGDRFLVMRHLARQNRKWQRQGLPFFSFSDAWLVALFWEWEQRCFELATSGLASMSGETSRRMSSL